MPDSELREQIARDLHDGVVQDLVAYGYSLDSIIARSDISPAARSQLRQIRLDASDLIKKFRAEIYRVRTPSIVILETLEEIFRGSDISLQVRGDLPILREPYDRELNRVMCEIAFNARKFSQAKNFIIETHRHNDHIHIMASDDGVGRAQIKKKHFGLISMKERITAIGGSLEMESNSDGTKVQIELPQMLFNKDYDSNSGSR